MTKQTTTRKEQKPVQIIARVQFKSDNRKVVYLVRSSNGIDQYEVHMFNGKACSCNCASIRPCRHMKGAEQKESERQQFQADAIEKANAREAALAVTPVSPVGTSQVIPMMPVAKSHAFAEMKAKYDVRNTTSKQRQEAPLQRQGFSLMR